MPILGDLYVLVESLKMAEHEDQDIVGSTIQDIVLQKLVEGGYTHKVFAIYMEGLPWIKQSMVNRSLVLISNRRG